MNHNQKVIISLAVAGRENYPQLQKGLLETLPQAGKCDHWIFNEYFDGITPHQKTPYLFKYDLIQRARNEGYKQVAWADSSMRLLKNPFKTLLDQSEKGVVAFDNIGHPAWKYTTDLAARNLSYTYDKKDFKNIAQTWGGFLMFDFSKRFAYKILADVFEQAKIGSFNDGDSKNDGFVAARHDQTVLSFLFHYYKIPLLPYGIIAAKQHITSNTVIQYGR